MEVVAVLKERRRTTIKIIVWQKRSQAKKETHLLSKMLITILKNNRNLSQK